MKKAYKITFALASITLLASCNLEVNPTGAAIMTAVNYEGEQRIVYSLDEDFDTPGYKDPDTGEQIIAPRHIAKGDYKPVWSTLQNRLDINLLEHQAAANSGTKKSVDYFRDNWMTKTHADISMGTVYDINNYSVAGNNETILDLKPYIDQTKFDEETGEIIEEGPLPNIAKFLHDNPGVKTSIVTAKHSHPDQGAIYYVPYFDGFDEIDKSPIMRADYVRRLLDDNPENSPQHPFSENSKILGKAEAGATYTQHYEPRYADGSDNAIEYSIKVPEVDASGKPTGGVVTIHKKSSVPNIITQQNNEINNGTATSKRLAKQFRDYIDDRYEIADSNGVNPFTGHYSDLFLGYNACYDSDELVALMRLVKVSSETLFGEGKNKEMVIWMPRVCDNQRSSDLYRWAGQTFGVRGTESRNSNVYMYMNGVKSYGEYGKYGAVHDACGTQEMLDLLNILRSLYQEGLILQDFDSKTATGTSVGKFADETLFSDGSDDFAGFMVYDWARDLNDWNKYKDAERKSPCDWVTPGENGNYPYDMRAVVGAVAKWDTNGEDGPDTFMPFTESWTSLKTSALCLNARLADNDEKRAATFKLIDYIFSDAGMFLYNYGPWEDGYITQMAGDYETYPDGVYTEGAVEGKDYIMYQGERFPCLTPEAKDEYMSVTGKTGYQRRFIGATIPFGFRKLSAVGYQTMQDQTKHGMDVVNKAIELGTFKHVLIGAKNTEQEEQIKNPFYQICPSAFFLTKGQSSAISGLLDKNKLGSIFTDSSTSNFNIWDGLVMGLPADKCRGVSLDNYIDKMKEWGIEKLEAYYQDAFEIMSAPIAEWPIK